MYLSPGATHVSRWMTGSGTGREDADGPARRAGALAAGIASPPPGRSASSQGHARWEPTHFRLFHRRHAGHKLWATAEAKERAMKRSVGSARIGQWYLRQDKGE